MEIPKFTKCLHFKQWCTKLGLVNQNCPLLSQNESAQTGSFITSITTATVTAMTSTAACKMLNVVIFFIHSGRRFVFRSFTLKHRLAYSNAKLSQRQQHSSVKGTARIGAVVTGGMASFWQLPALPWAWPGWWVYCVASLNQRGRVYREHYVFLFVFLFFHIQTFWKRWSHGRKDMLCCWLYCTFTQSTGGKK